MTETIRVERSIRIERSGATATIWLARPDKRNAISLRMMDELIAAFSELAADPTVKTTIVTGEGGVFSAGWDRDELLDRDSERGRAFFTIAPKFYRAMVGFPKPLIAAVDGYALGTAFDLALLSDVRVCSAGARFAHPEVKLGGVCLYTPLKDVVGAGWARELSLSGRSIDSEIAERIGFVNRVVTEGSALSAAIEIAEEMNEVPEETLFYTKAFLWTHPNPEEWLGAELDAVMSRGITIQHA